MAFEDITRQLKATDEQIALAKELAARGEYKKAEQILNNCLPAVVDFFGAGSLKTCNLLLDLAEIHYAREQYASVVTVLEQVLVTNKSETIYGAEEILSIRFKFAKALQKSGNYQDACNYYQDILEESKTVFGTDARFTRTIAESLSTLTRHHQRSLNNVESLKEQISQFDTGKNLLQKEAAGQTNSRQKDLQRFKTISVEPLAGPNQPVYKRYLKPGLSAMAASILCLGLLFSGILSDHDIKARKTASGVSNTAEATAAVERKSNYLDAGTYSSTDGLKTLTVDANGSGTLQVGLKRTAVSVSKCGNEVYLDSPEKKLVYRTARHGIIDDQNSILFKAGVPELDTAAAIRTLAANLNRYYLENGRYPSSQAQLHSMYDGARFKNPLNDGYSYPRLMSVIERRSANSMTLQDYNYANHFTARLVSDSQETGEPCGVEIYVCPLSDRGETVVIRGFDSNGKLLPSSHLGRCYAMILNNGHSHS